MVFLIIYILKIGTSYRILYDDLAKPEPLLKLCSGVVIARLQGDLISEGKLYLALIDVLRSTEVLKLITKPVSEVFAIQHPEENK